MRVPINPAHYIWLSTLEMGNVKPINYDKLDLAMNSDKSMSASSCTVLAEVLASEYKYINPDLDALLLQATQLFESATTENNSKSEYIDPNLDGLLLQVSQQFESTTIQRAINRIVVLQTVNLDSQKEKEILNS